jgi:hypothetical protein
MDGGLGSHIQRNPDDAARSNDQNDHFRTFNHAPPQLQSSDWSFAPAPQQTSQGLGMYNKNRAFAFILLLSTQYVDILCGRPGPIPAAISTPGSSVYSTEQTFSRT